MPGSTDVIVKVATMEFAYRSKPPNRQFESGGAEVTSILKQTQGGILHQVRGVCTGLNGNLR